MRIRKFTRRKKIWALFLFILCISVALGGGLALYYVNNFSDYLFSKKELLQSGKFEDTETLERKILDDTESIFQYVVLGRLFGDRDEDNKTVPLYVARINDTEYNLCLRDLENICEILTTSQAVSYGEEEQSGDDAAYAETVLGSGEAAVPEEPEYTPESYPAAEEWSAEEYQVYLDQFGWLFAEVYGCEENEWYDMSMEEQEAVIKENNWEDTYKTDVWPARVGLQSTAEILVYPGQTIKLVHDYLQHSDVNEDVDFISLYERGSGLLKNYYDLRNCLDGEETNLRFIVYEKSSGILQTNDSSAGQNVSEGLVEGNIQGLEKYVSYDNNTHRLRSNFTKADVKNWNLDYLSETLAGVDSGVSFTVGLDTGYPVQDEYKSISEGFRQCRPILLLSLPAIIAGMLGGIAAFFYLLASVGHREDYDAIWLDKFDQWPTEPAAFLILGGIFVFIQLCGILADVFAKNFFTSRLIYTVMQVISIIVSAIIALIGFFSLVKRLKAGVVWKNSVTRILCRKTAKWGHRLVENWPASGKAAGIILAYWAVTIPLCMFITINHFWGSSFLYFTGIVVFVGVQLVAAGIVLWAVISKKKILDGVERISSGDLEYVIDDSGMFLNDRRLVDGINHIGAGLQDAVSTAVQSERMKANLITNVSHDIKTPLTSIINYVDLMKRENIENETLRRYLDVLEQKSHRLKTLTEDLVEASRASSGNINLQLERINFVELVRQACGEFSEKFEERNLEQIIALPDYPLYVIADGRRVWRILENLFQNTKKYAMPHTRVYVSVEEQDGFVCFTMKNISESPLNITADELTERFTRGDTSRTTEGSGLGLSIAKNLTEVQDGIFEIYLNGDLFQATVQFELAEEEEPEDGEEEETGEESADGEQESAGEKPEPDGQADQTDSEENPEESEKLMREAIEELTSSGLLKKFPPL